MGQKIDPIVMVRRVLFVSSRDAQGPLALFGLLGGGGVKTPTPPSLSYRGRGFILALTLNPSPVRLRRQGEGLQKPNSRFSPLRPEGVSGKIGVNNLPHPPGPLSIQRKSNGEGEIPSSKPPSLNFF
jgi:hypothetical protein